MSQVHIRLVSLPVCPELHRTTMPQSPDLDKLLAVTGGCGSGKSPPTLPTIVMLGRYCYQGNNSEGVGM